MIQKLYSVKDDITGFKPIVPFFSTTGMEDEMAKRYFETHMNTQAGDPIMWTHPEVFNLYLIGTFDTESGTVMNTETNLPKLIMTGGEAYGNANKA